MSGWWQKPEPECYRDSRNLHSVPPDIRSALREKPEDVLNVHVHEGHSLAREPLAGESSTSVRSAPRMFPDASTLLLHRRARRFSLSVRLRVIASFEIDRSVRAWSTWLASFEARHRASLPLD